MTQANPYQTPSAELSGSAGQAQFRSLRGLQALLTPLLASYGVMEAVVAAALLLQPAEVDPEADLTAADLLLAGSFVVYALVLVATFVTFGRLLVRSNVNARSLGGIVKFTPASMVWWYFVPIANLFKPYEAFKTVWQASGSERDFSEKHPLMPLWWGTWIVINLLGNISWRLPDSVSGTFDLVTAPVTMACCYFAILVTRALTERQEAAALALIPAAPRPTF